MPFGRYQIYGSDAGQVPTTNAKCNAWMSWVAAEGHTPNHDAER